MLLFAVTGAVATPLAGESGGRLVERNGQLVERRNGMIKFETEKFEDGGELSYWGVDSDEDDAPEPTRTANVARQVDCEPDPQPSCDGKNQAKDPDCDNLISKFYSKKDTRIPKDRQSACYKGTDGECCASWSHKVEFLVHGDLIGPSEKIADQCATNGISGLIRGQRIEDACVHFCLSNRDSDNCGH